MEDDGGEGLREDDDDTEDCEHDGKVGHEVAASVFGTLVALGAEAAKQGSGRARPP